MYVFDASAMVNLVKRGTVTPLGDGVTLDLALYECLNAVWKEHALLGRLDRETALELADIIAGVFRVVKTVTIKGSEKEVLELAAKEKLTAYDASYLYTAAKRGLALVTDDEKLREKASKYVEPLASDDIARRSLKSP